MNIPKLDPEYCIEKQIYRHSKKNNALYLSTALGIFLMILALPFIKVDIIVHGIGVIRPITEKVELKSPIGETIIQVRANEGCRVQKGDTILVLNSASVAADKTNLRSLLDNLTDQISDLKALSIQHTTVFQSDKRLQENLLFQRQKEELKLSLEAAERKLKRNEPLFRSGVIPEDEFENYQHEKQRIERELKTLQENRLSLWKSDLNALLQQKEETKAGLRKLQEEQKLYVLTAPVQGTLEQFSGFYPGGNIASGQSIGIISPDSTLLVECYIQPKDIGFLCKGMSVRILAEAFDYNQWGMLRGQVSDIASDYQLVNEQAFYKVKCQLEKPYLSLRNGKRGYLKKGMTVQTRFLVNRRSLLQLIYEKMDDWANPLNK